MSGSSSGGPQQPSGSSYNFSYAAGTPPVGSSEYTYNAAVQDGRDSCYNMVYFPPNPTTGFNGHFSLVTPPQQHQETPIDGAVVNPAVTSSGQTMQDSWHPSSWASQAQATSNCNLMENNQHYSISTGFASQSDAEMALSTTGKCTLLIFKHGYSKFFIIVIIVSKVMLDLFLGCVQVRTASYSHHSIKRIVLLNDLIWNFPKNLYQTYHVSQI